MFELFYLLFVGPTARKYIVVSSSVDVSVLVETCKHTHIHIKYHWLERLCLVDKRVDEQADRRNNRQIQADEQTDWQAPSVYREDLMAFLNE